MCPRITCFFHYAIENHTNTQNENRFYFISFYFARLAFVCVCMRTHNIWFNNALNMRNICVDCIIWASRTIERTENGKWDNVMRWLQWHMTVLFASSHYINLISEFGKAMSVQTKHQSRNTYWSDYERVTRMAKNIWKEYGWQREWEVAVIPEIRCHYVVKMFICSLNSASREHILN